MNSSIAGVQSVQSTKQADSHQGVSFENRRIDVTGLPADRVAEYLQAGSERSDVYFERRAGKTFVVASAEHR